MIQWEEQVPDFRCNPLSELFAALPFTVALQITARSAMQFHVVVPRTVMRGIYAHLSQQNIEMGGLLIGRVFQEDQSLCVVAVEQFVPSTDFSGTGVSLKMGTSLWSYAREAQTAGQSVIGWYHSHPNLGVFFSGTDRRTQAAFFTQTHSLGLVIDPIRTEEMWFVGPASIQLAAGQVISTA